MNIDIRLIPHNKQRYETSGDFYWNKKGLQIRVSKTEDPEEDLGVIIHELVEALLTQKRGIKEEDILEFDLMFNEECNMGLHSEDAEPGEDRRAIYKKEHLFANKVENMLIEELKK